MPTNHDKALGQAIADFLHLEPIAATKRYTDPHYATTWGAKTAQVLGASFRHLINDHSELLEANNPMKKKP